MKFIVYDENVFVVVMESEINNKVQFGHVLDPLKNVAKVSTINNTSNLQDVFAKIDKLKKLCDAWIITSSDSFQVWKKYQHKGKSILKEYMPLLAGLI